MGCSGTSIDSNIVGLRVARETSPGVLPDTPEWMPLDPNSYGDFGAEYKSISRTPINAGRQRRKGGIVDKDISAGFETDFVETSLYPLIEGFMYSNWYEKIKAEPTTVSIESYSTNVTGFEVGDLIKASGFFNDANNGVKLVSAVAAGSVSVPGLAVETSPPTGAQIQKVGVRAEAGDIEISVASGIATIESTSFDFTTLGIIPGEWVFLGGDQTPNKFTSEVNNGFARVKSVVANSIVLDRQPNVMVDDTGAGKSIEIFVGSVIKNEKDRLLQKCHSYQFERPFGDAGFEYTDGCIPNKLELKVTKSEKLTINMDFVGRNHSDQVAEKSGTRPDPVQEDMFNASNDFSRIRLQDEETQSTMASYISDYTLTIDNGLTPLKAISTLGNFDVALGDFAVSGTIEAYFATFGAVHAIRDNDDVSLDFAIVKKNGGWLFDIPLVSLGNGKPKIEKDQPVMLPLSGDASEHTTLGYTLLIQRFFHLPTSASS